jgi:hypothetical protein
MGIVVYQASEVKVVEKEKNQECLQEAYRIYSD